MELEPIQQPTRNPVPPGCNLGVPGPGPGVSRMATQNLNW